MGYLYHLTTKDSIQSIFESGLIPQMGKRSKMVEETNPYVYLCTRKDLPYWKKILGLTTTLRIDENCLNKDDITCKSYSIYKEYKYTNTIPANAIKQVYVYNSTRQHEIDLCKDYIDSIDDIILYAIRYYEYNGSERDKKDLKSIYASTLYVLKKLDYSIVPVSEIRSTLKEIGESGEYTFLDRFKNTKFKLYQQIMNYKQDDLTPYLKELYDYITANFKNCLDMNTGGWTG